MPLTYRRSTVDSIAITGPAKHGAASWNGTTGQPLHSVCAASRPDPGYGTAFALALCCNPRLQNRRRLRKGLGEKSNRPSRRKHRGKRVSGYSILMLICSTALPHSDCQARTALDVVRGPTVDNAIMCPLNAQAMIARTNLVQGDGSLYMKVVCTPSKNADQWVAEVEARKAALQ
jgi:hypothetical protein